MYQVSEYHETIREAVRRFAELNRPGIRGGWLGQVVSSSRQMPR